MNRLHFIKPSIWRVFWTTLAVAAALSVLAGLGLYTGALANHSDTGSTPGGDYVRLFIVDLTLWGPMLVLTVWQITIPAIGVLGVLIASVRRPSKADPQKCDTSGEGSGAASKIRDTPGASAARHGVVSTATAWNGTIEG